MYIFRNAFKNLSRNRGRNLLLGIIMLILILSTTVALVIHTTTKGIIDDYKTRFGSKVTLEVDFDKLMSESQPDQSGAMSFPTAPQITSEEFIAFAQSKHLKSYKMNITSGIIFENLEVIGDKENDSMVNSIGGNADSDYVSPKAKLMSFSDANLLPDFDKGLRKIIEGDVYQGKDECLISAEFAELNDLQVNDEFKVIDVASKKQVMLRVSGIYADATKATGDLPEGSMSLAGAYGNRRNEIFVNLDTMKDNFDVNSLLVNAEYELKSPDVIKDFENEMREKGLPEIYNVKTDEASYQKIVAPVEGLSNISMTFMWVILAVGGMILLFVTSMAIRERKYEIGVLRAMGLKKAKITVMLISEMLMITSICLVVGIGIGNTLSQPIADTLIAGQIEAMENKQQPGMNFTNGSLSIGMNDSDVEPLQSIDVTLSLEAILQIVLIALALALLSSATGVIFITKYEPMKILSERN